MKKISMINLPINLGHIFISEGRTALTYLKKEKVLIIAPSNNFKFSIIISTIGTLLFVNW